MIQQNHRHSSGAQVYVKTRFSGAKRTQRIHGFYGVLSKQRGMAKASDPGLFQALDGHRTKGQLVILEA
jgi:hypothetical protein